MGEEGKYPFLIAQSSVSHILAKEKNNFLQSCNQIFVQADDLQDEFGKTRKSKGRIRIKAHSRWEVAHTFQNSSLFPLRNASIPNL